MLHFLLVLFVLALAVCETAGLLIPRGFIYLGNKENYDGVKKFFEELINSFEGSNSKSSVFIAVALVLTFVGGLLFLVASPFVLVFASLYSLYTGVGSAVFALIVLALSARQLYKSIPSAIEGVKKDLHPKDCSCEACAKKREVEAEIEAKGMQAVLNKITGELEKAEGKLLILTLPQVLYTWYLLYLIW